VIAGRGHLPAEYDGTPLGEILPVEFLPAKFSDDPVARPQPYRVERTPPGERAELLSLADTPEENRVVWRDLPGWYWDYPTATPRPGAPPMLGHATARLGDQPMPLLSAHFYGKGPVLFLASDETWRWRSNAQEKLHARFWGQMVYQTGLPHLLGNASRVQVSLERGEAVLGRSGYLYARLLDADYHPLTEPRIPATLAAAGVPPGAGKSRPRLRD